MKDSFIFYKSFYDAAAQAPDEATRREILWHMVEVCIGIKTVDDVLEMYMAGATAVQIGTENYNNPMVCPEIIHDLPARMDELGIESIQALIDQVKSNRASNK